MCAQLMDLIARSFQKGTGRAGDLLETLNRLMGASASRALRRRLAGISYSPSAPSAETDISDPWCG
jgi:hypothetical protein